MSEESDRMRANLQVIVGTLAVGVAVFLAIVWFLWHREVPREVAESAPLLSNLAAAMLVGALMVRFVVRRVVPKLDEGWPQFVVAGAAIIEFAGLFGWTAYLLEGTDLAFGVALVSIPLMLVLQFPTQARWEQWTGGTRVEDPFRADSFNLPDSYDIG